MASNVGFRDCMCKGANLSTSKRAMVRLPEEVVFMIESYVRVEGQLRGANRLDDWNRTIIPSSQDKYREVQVQRVGG